MEGQLMKIHPDDDMFTGSLEHYESVGRQLASHVATAAGLLNTAKPRILELPCGYGRVTRHLVSMFPESEIVASDIMVPATDFVTKEFGVKAYTAQHPVHELAGIDSDTFDIAVMGSLITHLSASNSQTLLNNFFRVVRPGGIAVITTHGIRSRQIVDQTDAYGVGEAARLHLIQQYDDQQFGFVNYLPDHSFEAKTVDYIGESYGISLIPDRWMTGICQANKMAVLNTIIGGWDEHQDVYLLQKQ
jgi:ubiquinone/menaquinone biosynthesis C-methylase UbiE